MRVSVDELARLAIVGLCVAALSACGGGGGGMPGPVPETPSLVRLSPPDDHGLPAGEIHVEAGASERQGSVVVSCPSGDETCMLVVADDGSVSYWDTGGMPMVAHPPAGRMAEALNAASPTARRNVAGRLARTAITGVASSTASMTALRPLTGGSWNTGVTQAPLNSNPDSPGDNRAINAWYVDGSVVFERIELEQGFRQNTRAEPAAPGYLAPVSSPSGAHEWRGVEHFFITRTGGRYYSVFYSDIEDGADPDHDYLALGYWAWLPDPGIDRIPFVGAAASGNDPFSVSHMTGVGGQATYQGAATGLYASHGLPPVFHAFDATVRLTADFDASRIAGAITAGTDSSTGAALFDNLVLEETGLRADATFFRGRVSGMLDGQAAVGRWGGQFYGNGLATADIPVSYAEAPSAVAGTFGARVLDGDSLLGVFGAYKESGQ